MDELFDAVAERQLLATALHGNLTPFLSVPDDAWTNWQAQEIARAIRTVLGRKLPVDGATVARALLAGKAQNRAEELNRTLLDLVTRHVPGDGMYYAERIVRLSAHRKIDKSVEHFRHMAGYALQNDDPDLMRDAVKGLREVANDTEAVAGGAVSFTAPESILDIIGEDDEPYDWLVPGLLERGDRLILTGFEGTGKSYLLAQMAACIAAGVHPFAQTLLPDRPYSVLVVDVENQRKQIRRRYERILGLVNAIRLRHRQEPVNWKDRLFIVNRPDGMDLTDPGQLAQLRQQIESTGADLVVAGPLYKMSRLNIQDEQAAQELTLTLDGLRTKYGFALICEAHAGHVTDGSGARRVRPIGSSLFLRWPEFGFGIIPHPDYPDAEHPPYVQVKHWRGSRDERDWPHGLQHGFGLPWEPLEEGYVERVLAGH